MKRFIEKLNKEYYKNLLAVFAITICLLNCEAAYNCLQDLKPPELPSKELKVGYLGKVYNDDLVPYVPQRSDTDVYVWDFQIEGQVPEGINIYLGSGRIIFEGVPAEAGIYEFKILLSVDSLNGTSLCDSATASKEYTIQIK